MRFAGVISRIYSDLKVAPKLNVSVENETMNFPFIKPVLKECPELCSNGRHRTRNAVGYFIEHADFFLVVDVDVPDSLDESFTIMIDGFKENGLVSKKDEILDHPVKGLVVYHRQLNPKFTHKGIQGRGPNRNVSRVEVISGYNVSIEITYIL